jgi:hypothetical protein
MVLGPIGITHEALGFYGFRATPRSVKLLYEAALRWFKDLECPPHLMGTSYDKGNLIRFSRSAAKLARNGFTDVESFQIDSLPPGGENSLVARNLHLDFSLSYELLGINARSSLAALTRNSLLRMAEEAISIIHPEYGIGFQRDENLDPGLFIHGFPYNTPKTADDRKECSFIAGWGNWAKDAQPWQHGFLRDVYPRNFLTAAQLEARIDDATLQDWIQGAGDRGTVAPFAKNMLLWEVPEAEISRVRSILREARVIFDAPLYHRIYEETRDGRLLPNEEILRRLKDPNYVLEIAPAPNLSEEQVLRMVLGDAAAEDVRVLQVDKSGVQPGIRELSTEEVRKIPKRKKKKQ